MENLTELAAKGNHAFKQATALLEEHEGKELPPDVQKQIDGWLDETEVVRKSIEQANVHETRLKRIEVARENFATPVKAGVPVGSGSPGAHHDHDVVQKDLARTIWHKYLRDGDKGLSNEEFKTLQITHGTHGGFLVAPEEFRNDFLKNVDDLVLMRQWGTVITLTGAESLSVPTLETDMNDADWTPELGPVVDDPSLRFGKRMLTPHMLTKLQKVSISILNRATSIDPEAFIRNRMAYKFGVTMEKSMMSGAGVRQPVGIFYTAAAGQGITSARDKTVTTNNILDADKVIEARQMLKPQYWPNARWVIHRDMLTRLLQLKTGAGEYLMNRQFSQMEPPTLLGRPYHVSEFAPNVMTGGNYVGIFGDLSYYWIVQRSELTIQRLVELFALTNEVGFVGRMEADAAPVLDEAFVRLKW
jgi:HK97 family phage major capsid protein